MISNCGHDERGKYKGGKAGDQTGTEWAIINWYNRPWKCVLRHPNAKVREKIAELSEKAAKNDNIGYDQNERTTYWEQLKKVGMWFVCADMDGTPYYQMDLKGPMGLVIGNEGEGVSRLIKETCDFVASIPMKGDIDSLNASVAAGVLAFEIARQRG